MKYFDPGSNHGTVIEILNNGHTDKSQQYLLLSHGDIRDSLTALLTT